jgi:uncharacterized membrane protein
MSTWPLMSIVFITFIPISIMLTFIPFLTRRTESFGVSLTEEIHALPENQRLRKQYSFVMGMLCGLLSLSIILMTAILEPEPWATALIVHLVALVIISFGVYLKYHFTMKRLKKERHWGSPTFTQRVVVDTAFHTKKVTQSAWWFLPQIIMIFLTAATGVFFYDRFPELIVMHYNLQGHADRFADKSYQAVLWPVAIQAVMVATMAFAHLTIARSKQQVDAADPEASLQRNIIFRRRWSTFMFILGFLMSVLFYFMQLTMMLELDPIMMTIIPFIMTGIILIYAVWLSFSTGQGGSRIKINGNSTPTGQTNQDDDQFWRLGQFYFNRNDPAYFVEKRFGVGWTINLARPLSWIILLAIILLPVVLSFLLVP